MKKDLQPLAEWQKTNKEEDVTLSIDDIRDRLKEARTLVSKGKTSDALAIYDVLIKQNVPEALYYSGTLALQDQNSKLSCDEALKMLNSAAEQGYTPAKKTLGFLLLFADDPDRLKAESYSRCEISENVEKGSALLVDASLEGDPDAQRLLDEYNSRDSGL